MHIRERGFSPVEILLIVAVIGLLIAVGYLFVQSVNKQDGNKSTESSETKKTDTNNDSKSALENIKAFYKKFSDSYTVDPNTTSNLDRFPVADWVKQNYTTQAAADQYTNNQYGPNLVTCSQEVLPYNKYTFTTPTITGSTGMIHITGTYETGDVMIMASLVKDGNTWKIDKFSCTM